MVEQVQEKVVELPYGRKRVKFPLPKDYELSQVAARSGHALSEPDQHVLTALREPIDRTALRNWVDSGDTVAIITSDATRPALQYTFLPHVLSELKAAGVGVNQDKVKLVIGLGTHRPPTDEEIDHLLGEAGANHPVLFPDCDNEKEFVQLGTTSRGTPVQIFRPVVEADKVILTGSIHHHVLAGFSAGPKSLLPAVASRKAVQYNHAMVMHSGSEGGMNPNCSPGLLDGNPLYEDFVEALEIFSKPTFLVNVIPAPEGGLLRTVAGDPIAAHRSGCETAEAYYGVSINETREFVLASCGGYPSDIVFYQSTKGLMNMNRALREGGVGILAAACSEGLGADTFSNWLQLGSSEAIEKKLRREFTVPGCIAFIVSQLISKATIILVSDLDPAKVTEFGIIPASDAQSAITKAVEQLGSSVEGYLLPKASITIPNL